MKAIRIPLSAEQRARLAMPPERDGSAPRHTFGSTPAKPGVAEEEPVNRAFVLSETRSPGSGMPPLDPSSVETDETFAAIISRDDTGKLTVARREPRRPTGLTESSPVAPAARDGNGVSRPR